MKRSEIPRTPYLKKEMPLGARNVKGFIPAHWACLVFRQPDLGAVFADDVTTLEEFRRLFMSLLFAAVDIAKRLLAAHAIFFGIVVEKVDAALVIVLEFIDEELRSCLKGREWVIRHDHVWYPLESTQCFGLIQCV